MVGDLPIENVVFMVISGKLFRKSSKEGVEGQNLMPKEFRVQGLGFRVCKVLATYKTLGFRKVQAQGPDSQIDAPDNQIDAPDNQIDDPDNQIDAPDNQIDAPDNQIDDPDDQIEAAFPIVGCTSWLHETCGGSWVCLQELLSLP